MTDQPISGAEPEYLGSDTPPAAHPVRRPTRTRWIAGAAVLGLVGAAAGGWAAAQLLGGGDGPASAVPSIAVAYVALDLDPTAAQKVEALRIAKKFPALAEELDLGVRDDLRRWLFEERVADVGCGLDYDTDVAPWIGDRLAMAAVPDGDGAASPLAVLAVEDREAAEQSVRDIEECVRAADESVGGAGGGTDAPGDEPVGVAFVGDYLLAAETQTDADSLATAAEAAPLAEDAAFADWMAEVGEPGVLTAYVAKDAPRVLTAAMGQLPDDLAGDLAGAPVGGLDGFAGSAPRVEELTERSLRMWKDFGGMAAVVRFADGALEVEAVGRGLPGGAGEPTGPSLGDLPASTAVAMTHSFEDGWFEDFADSLVGLLSAGESEEDFWAGLEAGSGLELPEDVERLFGAGVSLSVDASLDPEQVTPDPGALPAVPAALRIAGDTAEIRGVLDRLLALAGPMADQVVVEESDGVVTVGVDRAYVDRVLTEGGLAEQESFTAVVPEADRATSALFVGFDTDPSTGSGEGGWLARLVGDDAEARANLEPLDALGISSWRDGDVQHGLVRLTTD